MSVYSMTGYASASSEGGESPDSGGAAGGSVHVELRSVNNRFLDLSFRLPEELRGIEPTLREWLAAAFRRGKIEVRVSTGRDGAERWPRPVPEQLNQPARLEQSVQAWLPSARGLSVHEALGWCQGSGAPARMDEAALAAARRAIDGLKEARQREGERLREVLRERVARLRELAAQAGPLVPAVVQRQQQRFQERWAEALALAPGAAALPAEAIRERALGEAAAFAIRIDVAEELARLDSHLTEIDRLLSAGGELGKRLDFLIQELLREANTMGSKSAALELTNLAVEMKVVIEQLREQVQNIE